MVASRRRKNFLGNCERSERKIFGYFQTEGGPPKNSAKMYRGGGKTVEGGENNIAPTDHIYYRGNGIY